MGRKSAAETRVDEDLQILEAISFPLSLMPPGRQRRLARILLAVGKLAPKSAWREASAWEGAGSWSPRTRAIISFVNQHYGENISSGSYDDVRRKNLDFLVAYDPKREWIFLIEAVHSSNLVSRLRHLQLEKLTVKCAAGIVFMSAFKDRKTFAKWIGDISWETEVWLAESPDHMIHFNGDRFLGPHKKPGT
jgi:hypothetical protein